MALLAFGALVLAVSIFATQASRRSATVEFGDINDYVFVPSRGTPKVTLVDVESDAIAGTITLPRQPDQVLVSNAVERIIASNAEAQTITVFDFESQTVEAEVKLALAPQSIVLSPDGWLVAAADTSGGSVAIVSLLNNDVQATISGLNQPATLTFSDDSSLIYVADNQTGEVKLIDVEQNKVLGGIGLSVDDEAGGSGTVAAAAISALTRTPNGRYGVCAVAGSRQLAVLDLNDESEIKTLELGDDPSRPYGTADGRYMLIANNGDRSVSIIDTDSFDLAATLPGAADVMAINTGYFESVAFVVSNSEDRAVVIDLVDMTATGEIKLDSAPGPGVVTADGLKMYIALSGSNQLAVIDTQERSLLKTIANVGDSPWGATLAQTNNYCH